MAVTPTTGAASFRDRIVRNPEICGGQPVIRGTRVALRTILGYLAHGETAETILADFPSLIEEDVRAAVAFAAASTMEDLAGSGSGPRRDEEDEEHDCE
jgi:uncharacterized protein (DUF433 family)